MLRAVAFDRTIALVVAGLPRSVMHMRRLAVIVLHRRVIVLHRHRGGDPRTHAGMVAAQAFADRRGRRIRQHERQQEGNEGAASIHRASLFFPPQIFNSVSRNCKREHHAGHARERKALRVPRMAAVSLLALAGLREMGAPVWIR